MLFFSLLHLFLARYLSHVNPLVHEKHLYLQGNRIVRLHDGNVFGREKGDHTLPRKFTRFRQNDHLIGLRGRATDGRDLGALKDVLQPGGNDVYVFRGPLGEVLVPALKSVVARVDLDAGEILFDARRLDEVAVFDED